ncbi:MAG: S24/S26 family peptidase [Terriglobales bacterium]
MASACERQCGPVQREVAAECVRMHGRLRFRATGDSMRPVLQAGDILEVERRAWEAIQPGDIVLCDGPGAWRAHRVLRRAPGVLITCGEALGRLDPPQPRGAYLGHVIRVERNGRRFVPARRLPGIGWRARGIAVRWRQGAGRAVGACWLRVSRWMALRRLPVNS